MGHEFHNMVDDIGGEHEKKSRPDWIDQEGVPSIQEGFSSLLKAYADFDDYLRASETETETETPAEAGTESDDRVG